MRTIKFTVTPTGETTVEVNGVKGKACRSKDILEFEQALGKSKGTKLKPEYYQQAGTTQKVGG